LALLVVVFFAEAVFIKEKTINLFGFGGLGGMEVFVVVVVLVIFCCAVAHSCCFMCRGVVLSAVAL